MLTPQPLLAPEFLTPLLFCLSIDYFIFPVFELYTRGLVHCEFLWDVFLWLRPKSQRCLNMNECSYCTLIFTAALYSVISILLLMETWVVSSFSLNLCRALTST